MIRSVFRTARTWTIARALGRASSSDATTIAGANSAKDVDAATEDNAATAAGGAEEGQHEDVDLDFDNLFDEIAVSTTEPREEKSFAKMLRESKFMQLGDFNGRMVLGKVVRRVGNDLYVDFGLKFHAVCRAKPEDIGRYVMGSSVLLRLHDPELSERFLGSTRDLTLLEADATLIGPYRPGAKRGRPTGKAPPSEATMTAATASEAAV